MATITLKYDGRSKVMRGLIAEMIEAGAERLSELPPLHRCALDDALDDIREGRVTEITDIDAFLDEMKAQCGN